MVQSAEVLPKDGTTENPILADAVMLKLAREIGMDLRPLSDILSLYNVDSETWDRISRHPRFQSYLQQQAEEWNSAKNTTERVRVKSLAFVEEALPEFYARAHDPREGLSAKVELLKTVAKFAGVGGTVEGAGGLGERFSVTINLGADQQLRIEKDITPQVTEEDRL